ncbi:MAG: pyridoxine 5'-phosphate synthase [Alphaproteobacteria bacterium]
MTRLSVNLNKVCLLRNQRDVGYPDVSDAAVEVLAAGAEGITLHPRPDRRHVKPCDVRALTALLHDDWPARPLNLEGYPDDDFLALVAEARPAQVTLVPDAPDARTSSEGWRLCGNTRLLRDSIEALRPSTGRIALLIDPDPTAPAVARAVGADAVEIFTGGLVGDAPALFLNQCQRTALSAADVGVAVHGGHDLNLDNLRPFLAAVPACAEVSIGHALVADALRLGWRHSVGAYLAILRDAGPARAAPP